ncbi:putative fatty acyl-CoA reductase CG5065 [Oratosquilla oratoria]|uniref:putative fatty acyl-CoA reductase CG5065 n=1 Tax=Oratosquilla oratoria TaxID=337810 RepID=UPI003F777B5C
MAAIGESDIVEWYRDKTVFITGGSGFMGKVLLEKILRVLPVRRVYLLMRPKRGLEIHQRLEDMVNYKLFDVIKATQPEVLQKVVAVKGDITMEGLGLSDSDEMRLAQEVAIIFHAAATINFQEPMRVAVNMNMLGTKRVVSLAKKMDKLESFVHVSTAYGNCHLQEIYEELYPAPMDPGRLIQLTEWLNDDLLNSVTPKIISPRPNTYTYTKALAEHLLVNDAGKMPISIIRPSIVCGAWKEPLPGWVDNLFAFTGLLVGMGKGVLRTLYIKPGIKLDFIPVDMPINLMLVSAWNTAVKKYNPPSVPIYCCATGSETPLTVEKLTDHLKTVVREYPLSSPLWYPDGSAKNNKTIHTLHLYLVNIIPAYIADFIMKLLGKKTIAIKLCTRMAKAINALEYFMLRDWTFHSTNTQMLWNSISQTDRKLFHFSVADLDWGSYIRTYQLGCKQYLMKESLDTLPADRRQLQVMLWVHRLFQLVLMYGAWCIVSSDSAVNFYSLFLSGASRMLSLAPVLAAAEETEAS